MMYGIDFRGVHRVCVYHGVIRVRVYKLGSPFAYPGLEPRHPTNHCPPHGPTRREEALPIVLVEAVINPHTEGL